MKAHPICEGGALAWACLVATGDGSLAFIMQLLIALDGASSQMIQNMHQCCLST